MNDLKIAIIETDGVYGIKAKDALQKCKIFIEFCFDVQCFAIRNEVTPVVLFETYIVSKFF